MKMSLDVKAELDAFNKTQSDWYTECRVCGAELVGTLKDLRAHVCEGWDGSPR